MSKENNAGIKTAPYEISVKKRENWKENVDYVRLRIIWAEHLIKEEKE